MYEFLLKYPVRFQRQKVIDNYIAYFYCAKAKLVVEVDGSSHYECDQIEHDKIWDIALAQFGLKTICFTNLEIAQNFEGVCLMIDEIIKSRTSLPQSTEVDSSLF